MLRVLKFGPITPGDVFSIFVPYRWKFIHFGEQRGELFLWLEVDSIAATECSVKFLAVGTGWEFTEFGEHKASIVTSENYVWHLYGCLL